MNNTTALQTRIQELEARIEELQDENYSLTWDHWNIRSSSAARLYVSRLRGTYDIIYGDVNELHISNKKYGERDANERVRLSLKIQTRLHEQVDMLRWQSGDELVFICPAGSGHRFVNVIKQAFVDNGMSISLEHETQVSDGQYIQAIEDMQDRIRDQKPSGLAGLWRNVKRYMA